MINSNWTQTFYHVTINIELNPEICAKDIKCHFGSNKLSLSILDNLIFGEILEHSIYPDESSWYIEKNPESNRLYIELAKVETKDNKGWWAKCFQNDIEKTKQPERLTRSIYDCSPELQRTAREMAAKMYNPDLNTNHPSHDMKN